jgi:hypothetical protein
MHPDLPHPTVSDTGAKPTKSAVAPPAEPNGNTNRHPGYGFKLRGPRGRRTKSPRPERTRRDSVDCRATTIRLDLGADLFRPSETA